MYGLMKMPEPMMPLMTIIVASNSPSARLNGCVTAPSLTRDEIFLA